MVMQGSMPEEGRDSIHHERESIFQSGAGMECGWSWGYYELASEGQ